MTIHWEPLERVTLREAGKTRCACGRPGMFRAHGFGLKPKRLCPSCEKDWEPEEGFGGFPRYESGEQRHG